MSKRDLVLAPVVREFRMSDNPVCHNCCHDFSCSPVKIPTPYGRSYGHFCSYGCALRYLTPFEEMRIVGDVQDLVHGYNLETRSLMCVKTAPPRICLKMFGGPLSIESYRLGKKCSVQFNGLEYIYHM